MKLFITLIFIFSNYIQYYSQELACDTLYCIVTKMDGKGYNNPKLIKEIIKSKDTNILIIDASIPFTMDAPIKRYLNDDFTPYKNGASIVFYKKKIYKKYFSKLYEKSNGKYYSIGYKSNIFKSVIEMSRNMKDYNELPLESGFYSDLIEDFLWENKWYRYDNGLNDIKLFVNQLNKYDSLKAELFYDTKLLNEFLYTLKLELANNEVKGDVEQYMKSRINRLIGLNEPSNKIYLIIDIDNFLLLKETCTNKKLIQLGDVSAAKEYIDLKEG